MCVRTVIPLHCWVCFWWFQKGQCEIVGDCRREVFVLGDAEERSVCVCENRDSAALLGLFLVVSEGSISNCW